MSMMEMVDDLQRQFHDAIAGDMTAIHDSGSLAAFGSLALAGFLYGIFHAIGPGHGKVVVSSYMLADDTTVRKGLTITVFSSLLQAVVAVALVLVLFYGLGLARDKTEYAAAWFECVSFGLVALIGATLIMKGLNALSHRGHVHDEHCGHNHGPDASMLKKDSGWKTMAVMIASIGIRPCSGALILMFFACLLGEIWAGIAATFAMSVGTAITVSTIALAAAGSKRGLLKFVGTSERFIGIAGPLAKIIGGGLIFFLAVVFCYAAIPDGSSTTTIAPYNHPLMVHRR